MSQKTVGLEVKLNENKDWEFTCFHCRVCLVCEDNNVGTYTKQKEKHKAVINKDKIRFNCPSSGETLSMYKVDLNE